LQEPKRQEPPRAPRVLVVEDDAPMAAGLVRGLRGAGFAVELACDGEAAVRLCLEGEFDAMVLDVRLPRLDGFAVLEKVRPRTSTKVLMLTASGDLPQRLRAFELGAVDFVPKPFWIEELVARIRAQLKERPQAPSRLFAFGEAEVDLDRRLLRVQGEPVELTQTEWALLLYLLERPGRPVSRDTLIREVLAPFEAADARTVDSHVAHLRKKLGEARAAIATVWGIGYRFQPREEG
jgi:two-component system, OmpR family, response regulator